ncbi:MAG: argininosuccinate lyase [Oscillospiraceae bacterium]|nr:argininosuccinate lyase [Oscillospiraceae bacterium]
MKMWEGRFSKKSDSALDAFNSSIAFDSRMYREDITGSIAHARMLGKQEIISKEAADEIVSGLEGILTDIETGKLEISPDAEDIHMFIEEELSLRIGENGKRLHTARSRNDQVALDIKMYIKNMLKEVKASLLELLRALYGMAEKNTDTVMPGYTHLQRAQPVTFSHYMLAYAEMIMRDIDRLTCTYHRANVMPLGSGALASTTYPLDRHFVATSLNFADITYNSLDGVSDRDSVIEFAFDLSVVMMHLSRLSEEIILWSSSEFSFVELDDAFSTGSSIMPQKKNPDIPELVRGKTGRVYGDLTALLVMMKSLPLAYNKDMQEDKEALFDAIDNSILCINIFARMLPTLKVKRENMRAAASGGFINATDLADYLTKKGMPFRTAYKTVGSMVAYCNGKKKGFENLEMTEYNMFSDLFDKDVFEAINLENCVARRDIVGGPGPHSTEIQLARLKDFIESNIDNR